MGSIIDRIMDAQKVAGLEKAMQLNWRRNEAIGSNIANAETPGYRSMDLNFGRELEQAFGKTQTTLNTTNPKHLDLGEQAGAHLVPDYKGATKPDGNNVDIDIQMGELALNSAQYGRAARFVRKQFAMLKYAIREGAR